MSAWGSKNFGVTAVIPTHRRAGVLPRAVRSALSQTYANLDVVVVVDGPDAETTRALAEMAHPRLRVVELDRPMGGCEARNAGVNAASGEWIAFLDDDDEWLPNKIARQMGLLPSIDCRDPIISCRFEARTDSGEYVWPERFPRPGEPISEYLLVRQGIRRVDGFVATPTILTRRSLLERVPFQPGLKKHQDWDWVIRAVSQPGVGVFFCPEALAVCHMESSNSTSRRLDWEFSLDWVRNSRHLVTPRAYSSFITTHVAWQAAAQRSWLNFGPLLWDAFRNGSLRLLDIMRYLGFWAVPPDHRQWMKKPFSKSLLTRQIATTRPHTGPIT